MGSVHSENFVDFVTSGQCVATRPSPSPSDSFPYLTTSSLSIKYLELFWSQLIPCVVQYRILIKISSHDRRRKQEASRRSLFDRWRLSKSYKIWHPKFQKFPESYLICWQSNKTRSKTPKRRAVAILELAHVNLDDHYTASPAGYRFFLAMIDNFTRYVWIWLLRSKYKESSITAIKEF